MQNRAGSIAKKESLTTELSDKLSDWIESLTTFLMGKKSSNENLIKQPRVNQAPEIQRKILVATLTGLQVRLKAVMGSLGSFFRNLKTVLSKPRPQQAGEEKKPNSIVATPSKEQLNKQNIGASPQLRIRALHTAASESKSKSNLRSGPVERAAGNGYVAPAQSKDKIENLRPLSAYPKNIQEKALQEVHRLTLQQFPTASMGQLLQFSQFKPMHPIPRVEEIAKRMDDFQNSAAGQKLNEKRIMREEIPVLTEEEKDVRQERARAAMQRWK